MAQPKNDQALKSNNRLLWPAAALYVLSQTVLLKEVKDYLSILSMIFTVASVTLAVGNTKLSVRYVLYPAFLVLALGIMVTAMIAVDPEKNLTDLLKIFVLIYASVLFFDINLRPTLERFADGALVATISIVGLATIGLIPTAQFSAVDLWTKEAGGFANPNNAPYFACISCFLYFLIDKRRKLWAAGMLNILLLLLGVFSRTYLTMLAIIITCSFFSIYFPKIARYVYISMYVTSLPMIVIGVAFYVGVIAFPQVFYNYQGTWIDMITSYRISIAFEDPVYASGSILGYSIKKMDSLYAELIYAGGPILLASLILRYILNPSFKIYDAYEGRKYFVMSLILIAGLFEIQLLNLTPLSALIFYIAIGKPSMNTPDPRANEVTRTARLASQS